jgi:hypothetical protein
MVKGEYALIRFSVFEFQSPDIMKTNRPHLNCILYEEKGAGLCFVIPFL